MRPRLSPLNAFSPSAAGRVPGSFDQHEGRRKDVVLELWNAPVHSIVEILDFEHDPIREVDVHASGRAPRLREVSAVGTAGCIGITKPDEGIAVLGSPQHAEMREQKAVEFGIAATVEL